MASLAAVFAQKRTALAVLFFRGYGVTAFVSKGFPTLGALGFSRFLTHTCRVALCPGPESCMKTIYLLPLALSILASPAFAQDRIYRCGNEYTNTITEAQAKTCKLVSGGNVTVVPAAKAPSSNAGRPAAPSQPGAKVDPNEQRAKDSDAKLILESELKKAEARQAELVKEYNNGEPDKVGGEARNHQKYLDRVAELKASIARNESDIAGIRRELSRLPASGGAKP